MRPRSDPPPCPQVDRHTPCPDGYVGWHHWAERMSKTHIQIRCPGCDLWAIWLPKTPK
jgi:hypothetical protein